ncbi:MAG TPA: hypothetical protein VIZ90_19445 [Rhizobiaceae bacterium]
MAAIFTSGVQDDDRAFRATLGRTGLSARSCVRADMMVDCKVEIEVIAYDPG